MRGSSVTPEPEHQQPLGSWIHVSLTINGESLTASVAAERRLASLLRDDLGLTGTKVSCEVGVCGACTVLIDGRPRSSCLTLIAQIEGTEITTIEGLDDHPDTNRLRAAFVEQGGFQCGFCTSGQLVSATALLSEPSCTPREPDEVAEYLTGNLCRCTGYYGILRAVTQAQP